MRPLLVLLVVLVLAPAARADTASVVSRTSNLGAPAAHFDGSEQRRADEGLPQERALAARRAHARRHPRAHAANSQAQAESAARAVVMSSWCGEHAYWNSGARCYGITGTYSWWVLPHAGFNQGWWGVQVFWWEYLNISTGYWWRLCSLTNYWDSTGWYTTAPIDYHVAGYTYGCDPWHL